MANFSSYNFNADEFKISKINTSMRSNLKNGVSVDMNFTHDPYKFDGENNVRIDELDKFFPKMVAARLATNFTIRSKSEPTDIKEEKEFSEDTKKF
ncbi:MAG: hypothetical protein CM1200mP31_5920 [Candidatus Neomarinimicrobiota bacterium]|nr:MAG: hypothetical protein CM1200mP31_5920 [Candidatus Neomarinimicrobiota bacterium]